MGIESDMQEAGRTALEDPERFKRGYKKLGYKKFFLLTASLYAIFAFLLATRG